MDRPSLGEAAPGLEFSPGAGNPFAVAHEMRLRAGRARLEQLGRWFRRSTCSMWQAKCHDSLSACAIAFPESSRFGDGGCNVSRRPKAYGPTTWSSGERGLVHW
jgi:hypothetical protein